VAALVACALAFCVFAIYRVRYVGGCDSSAYLLESMRIRGAAPGLELDPDVPFKGPLAPLCMVERRGLVFSFFPPGFPLLLALGGYLGAPFFVTPVLGAASGLALFFALRVRSHPAIALGTMLAWLCSPMVFWGSTQVMSDLPACAFAVFCVCALLRGRPRAAGALLGFSLAIRPTQVLLFPVLVLLAPKLRTQARVVVGLALALAAWALFLVASRGGLWTSYGHNLADLDGAAWKYQLPFLLRQTLLLHVPVALLALVSLARPSAVLPWFAWFGLFLGLYSLWHWPFDDWWWMRYLLPALPAVFLAAAEGATVVADRLRGRSRSAAAVVGAGMVGGYAAWTFFASPAKSHTNATFDVRYPLEVASLEHLVPAGSLVGSLNLSGPLRLYSRYQSFFWCHEDTPALIEWAVEHGRPVYLALDDAENDCNRAAKEVAARHGLYPNAVGTLPSGRVLRLLGPPR
jgi:hypothetical protein